jgi:hypothetical protein
MLTPWDRHVVGGDSFVRITPIQEKHFVEIAPRDFNRQLMHAWRVDPMQHQQELTRATIKGHGTS